MTLRIVSQEGGGEASIDLPVTELRQADLIK